MNRYETERVVSLGRATLHRKAQTDSTYRETQQDVPLNTAAKHIS